jgi:hypothetical protein
MRYVKFPALFIFSAHLSAQMVDCNVSPGGYKILLDDVVYSGPAAAATADQKLFMNRLRVKLISDLEALKVQTQLPFTIVRCEGRRPVDVSDFRVSLVDGLNSRNVLVEMWGNIVAVDASVADTAIGFALIPVRFYERDTADLPGIYVARYNTRVVNSAKLLEIIGASRELKVFVLVAGGTKALRERRYNEAYTSLCDASQQAALLKAEGVQSHREPLGKYARRMALDTVRKATKDSTYLGPLSLVNEQNICGAR